MNFETQLLDLFNRVVRYIRVQPLILGGYSTVSGGQGGPPGGVIGQLPQIDVAYDTSEAATASTPASGASLLDNLNHIRYRLGTIEGSGNYGIDVYEDHVLISPNIQIVDFIDNFSVEPSGEGVTVSLLASGVQADATYSGIYGENLTSQINGVTSHFTVADVIYNDSLAVYLNGIRQNSSVYTVDVDQEGFTTDFVPVSGDTLVVDYSKVFPGSYHTHSQYVTSGDTYTREEVLALLQAFSRTVNQQIVFTFPGSGTIVSGLDPLRIWAHDVNLAATITEIKCGFNTPPASEVRVNVLKNGYTIFNSPSYVSVPSGAYVASKTTGFYESTFVQDDYFQVKIEKGDSTARDMTVHIRFSYELD